MNNLRGAITVVLPRLADMPHTRAGLENLLVSDFTKTEFMKVLADIRKTAKNAFELNFPDIGNMLNGVVCDIFHAGYDYYG